jgi:hypothetical protein
MQVPHCSGCSQPLLTTINRSCSLAGIVAVNINIAKYCKFGQGTEGQYQSAIAPQGRAVDRCGCISGLLRFHSWSYRRVSSILPIISDLLGLLPTIQGIDRNVSTDCIVSSILGVCVWILEGKIRKGGLDVNRRAACARAYAARGDVSTQLLESRFL